MKPEEILQDLKKSIEQNREAIKHFKIAKEYYKKAENIEMMFECDNQIAELEQVEKESNELIKNIMSLN